MSESTSPDHSLASRAKEELKRYLVISAYLFVCFSVIMMYDASQSDARTASWAALAVALGKALVLGKFILIGDALGAGTRRQAPTLFHRVAWRSVGTLVVLVILKLLEELIVCLVHGKNVGAILAELGGQTWLSLVPPVLLMLLILIPMITATEIDRALGSGGLKGFLLSRRP
jgi:hypothetical protein